MKIKDTSTPVVVLNCKLAALGIMRSLGQCGVDVYGVDGDPRSPGMLSRYCRGRFIRKLDESDRGAYLGLLKDIASKLNGKPGARPVLIPTSDETAIFVAENTEELMKHYVFQDNDAGLVRGLASKKEMYLLAKEHAIPTPHTEFPESLDDVLEYAKKASFPVMLKGVHGNRLQERTGLKMVIVHDRDELLRYYKYMEDPELPNLMLQEYIPGDDDQIYIFNGYFNSESRSLASFTGHKIRQFPIHTGCASLGVSTWNKTVAGCTEKFMKEVGYRGILDIGYRLDPRDGLYKVLDINPRIGQAFRLFLAENGMDVARALYMDLTGQETPQVVPREGRRWLIEDYDIISTFHYFQENSLTVGEWLRSFRRVEEGAWFSLKDPVPFMRMLKDLVIKALGWATKRGRSGFSSGIRSRKA